LDFGYSVIAGGLTLAIMIIPLLLRSSIEAITAIPRDYQEGSLALDATKWQTIRNVVIPSALPGISSGVIISVGRAIGETAAIIFTAGYAVHVASSLMHPTASLSNLIYKNYGLSIKFPEFGARVYSASLILIVIILILNAPAKLISYRASKMTKGQYD
jgi:phosphate transport system permease protein